ncbi:LEAF RUST 10 DISEASE-RESISTANCE LOCUS RECEPTOR-LIKE PROTEIN KINASE-like 1.1 [Herrania umbratica]|uniref:LEAF RUST 10 DISEASE-RESISTANCE LOCUS RECEPTOR-LIKE PROTEIN KINASE-like 1.1 n=1 Tax=Herrania umbratica TaxID=108875 RepID=A0A6J1BKQ6_9ROSI|nr:LEAF RUST 10 DISEASE-RESISTANCE LOCUS RECEPTOR-LIKE PROTEIN KINASE-like 1.1 [Herrania umbratica]
MAAVSLLVLIVLSPFVLLHFAGAEEENSYPYHPDCPPFPCGKLGEIRFPYTQRNRTECGLFVVDDCQGIIQKVQLQRGERWYQVNSISQAGTITIYDEVLAKRLETKDCESLKNLSFPNLPHVTFEIVPNLTLCKCNSPLNPSFLKKLSYTECKNSTVYYRQPNPQGMPEPPDNMSSLCNCPIIQLPSTNLPPDKNPLKENSQLNNHLFHMLTPNVSVRVRVSHWCKKCHSRGGECLAKKQRFHCSKGICENLCTALLVASSHCRGCCIFSCFSLIAHQATIQLFSPERCLPDP